MFKHIVLFIVGVIFFSSVGPVLAEGQVNVFIYHRFGESRYPSTNISPEIFRQQLAYLRDNQYQVLSLGEVVRRLRANEPLPANGAAICVDDAFTSFAEVGMPIIREFGFPVSLYINTDSVGAPGYLSWEDIRALHAEGVEVGNHTATHDYLVELQAGEDFTAWRQRVVADIEKAQNAFSAQLKVAPEVFVYPYGEYSDELVAIVKELGFSAAFAQQSGVVHAEHDLFNLPRFPMGGPYATLEGFVEKLRMKPLVVAEAIPYSPVVRENPPGLLVKIPQQGIAMGRVNCFAQAGSSCQVEKVSGREGWYRVTADSPLQNRRNKYTLTVPGKSGGWHWYSHLWLNADNPATAPTVAKGED